MDAVLASRGDDVESCLGSAAGDAGAESSIGGFMSAIDNGNLFRPTAEEAAAIAAAGLSPDTVLYRSGVAISGYMGVSPNYGRSGDPSSTWRSATSATALGSFDTPLLGAIAYAQAISGSTAKRNAKRLLGDMAAQEALDVAQELGLGLAKPPVGDKRAMSSKSGYVGVSPMGGADKDRYRATITEKGKTLYLRGTFREPAEAALRRAQVLAGEGSWLIHEISAKRLAEIADKAGGRMLGGAKQQRRKATCDDRLLSDSDDSGADAPARVQPTLQTTAATAAATASAVCPRPRTCRTRATVVAHKEARPDEHSAGGTSAATWLPPQYAQVDSDERLLEREQALEMWRTLLRAMKRRLGQTQTKAAIAARMLGSASSAPQLSVQQQAPALPPPPPPPAGTPPGSPPASRPLALSELLATVGEPSGAGAIEAGAEADADAAVRAATLPMAGEEEGGHRALHSVL